MTDPKRYFGNNPNSPNYDPNIPIGSNKWDEQENDEDNFSDDEQIEDEEDLDYSPNEDF